MDAVAVLIDEDVPTLHVVIVKKNDLKVLLLSELNLIVVNAKGRGKCCDELRGVLKAYLNLIGVLMFGEGLDGNRKIVVEKVEFAGRTGRVYVRVVE